LAKDSLKLKIRSFEAVVDLGSCLSFAEGYINVLAGHGINIVYVNRYDWCTSPNIFGIIAEYNEKVVGGILLYKCKGDECVFPFNEIALLKDDKSNIDSDCENSAELFALWHSKETSGWGLSYLLIKAGIALSLRLGIEKTMYLVADYNSRMIDKLGLEPVRKNEKNVTFDIKVMSMIEKAHLYQFLNQNGLSENMNLNPSYTLSKEPKHTVIEYVLGNQFEIEYNIQ